MRKICTLGWIALFTIGLLIGCSQSEEPAKENQSSNESTSEEVAEATITVTISKDKGEEVIDNKEIDISEGDILMDVMKENFDIEEEEGFIHSIDGIAPEEGEEKSWMYFVNDEMAMVGANEYELESGDEVVFDLQPWE